MILTVLAVAAAGGVGAACRFLLDTGLRRRFGTGYPVGTLVINVSGSLLLGLLAGLVSTRVLPSEWREVGGAGFLGGYTTFSTAAVEAVLLAQDRRLRAAAVASAGMLVLSALAAAAGLAAGLLAGTAVGGG